MNKHFTKNIQILLYSPWTRPEKAKKKIKTLEIQFRLKNFKRHRIRVLVFNIKYPKNTFTFEIQTYITNLTSRKRLSLKTFMRLKFGLGSSYKS